MLVVVLGKRGTGKSTLARWLRDTRREGRLVRVRDRMGEWSPEESEILEGEAEEAAELAVKDGEAGIPTLTIFDEADIDISCHKPLTPCVRALIHYGRHLDAACILIARRPVSLHPDVRALATEAFIGRLTGDLDLAWVRSWLDSKQETIVRGLDRGEFLRLDLGGD